MNITRTKSRLAAVVAAGAVAAAPALAAAPAHAASTGTRSLATVLAADGNHFDRNWSDFDIVDRAVHAVLANDPQSPVAVLADGTKPLTAFLPTDRAFRTLVVSLTGERKATERGVWRAVKKLGIDTVETVLLYHVVPGATITYRQALHANGAQLTTAQGGVIRVRVVDGQVRLRDRDPNAANPTVIRADKNINRGNKQIAHGINRVLRPVDL